MDFDVIEKLNDNEINDLFDNYYSDFISVTCYCVYVNCGKGGSWCGGADTRSSSYCQFCSAGYCGSLNSVCGYSRAGYECC